MNTNSISDQKDIVSATLHSSFFFFNMANRNCTCMVSLKSHVQLKRINRKYICNILKFKSDTRTAFLRNMQIICLLIYIFNPVSRLLHYALNVKLLPSPVTEALSWKILKVKLLLSYLFARCRFHLRIIIVLDLLPHKHISINNNLYVFWMNFLATLQQS